MSVKEQLKEKITSKSQFERIPVATSRRTISQNLGQFSTWWVDREYARRYYGIYETTDVVDLVNGDHPALCVHLSTDDREYVAYTPDAVMGAQDRQVKTSLGKLLAKLYPYVPDHVVQDWVAKHRADLSNEFEILTGKALLEGYQTGPSSCMRTGADTPDTHHLNAYDAPNISMAVLRNKEGVINARSMLYTPTEDDKRFIRCYGDSLLRKRLLRAGYKSGTWQGAEFKLISLGDNKYAIPYLDANEGPGSERHCSVAIMDNKLVVLSEGLRMALAALRNQGLVPSNSISSATNACGYVFLTPVETDVFMKQDSVTGNTINTLVESTVPTYIDGKLGVTTEENADDLRKVYLYSNHQTQSVYITESTPTFLHRHSTYVDNEETRTGLGYNRLSEKYYSGEDLLTWHLRGVTLEDGSFVKKEDAVVYLDNTVQRTVHKSAKKKEWVLVHKVSKTSLPTFAGKEAVVRTDSGRKVVPDYHDVVQLWDGSWSFSRGTRSIYKPYLGSVYYKGTLPPESYWTQIVYDQLQQGSRNPDVNFAALRFISDNERFYYDARLGSKRVLEVSTAEEWEAMRHFFNTRASDPLIKGILKAHSWVVSEMMAVEPSVETVETVEELECV